MDTVRRIEWVLAEALAEVDHPGAPRSLAAALKHAVFPGGQEYAPAYVWRLQWPAAMTVRP